MKTAIASSLFTILAVVLFLQLQQIRQLKADRAELAVSFSNQVAALQTEIQELQAAAARQNAVSPATAAKTQELINDSYLQEGMGKISHEKAQEIRDELTGKVKYYKAPDGSLTTNRFWTAK
ncbi:MAG: hypothetical protein WCH99_04920 [Verrucomicrobiota bacterium]